VEYLKILNLNLLIYTTLNYEKAFSSLKRHVQINAVQKNRFKQSSRVYSYT